MDSMRTLLVVAAPIEAEAVLEGLGVGVGVPAPWERVEVGERVDLVLSGVAQANAAAATALAAERGRHGSIVSLGIAGSLPGRGVAVRDAVVATSCVPDSGLITPEGFVGVAEIGFPLAEGLGSELPTDAGLVEGLRGFADHAGPIATVSVCSGTDAVAAEVASRTGALAEAMEGVAVGLVARGLGIRFAEFRTISNETGDRASHPWDFEGALGRLRESAGVVVGAVLGR